MVLYMKPIVEILNLLGPDNTLLPDKWRRDCKTVLSALKYVFPMFEDKDKPAMNYPFNLIELYVDLYLLVHQKANGRIEFELFDRLFLSCELAIKRN